MGRPSSFTQEIADEICDRISQAESLVKICQDEHMPNCSTVFAWSHRDAEFSKNLARAREACADYISHQILDIADEQNKDWKQGKYGLQVDKEAIERSKVRIDTRIKLMQMLKPKSYGPKLDVSGELGIKTVMVPADPPKPAPVPPKPEF